MPTEWCLMQSLLHLALLMTDPSSFQYPTMATPNGLSPTGTATFSDAILRLTPLAKHQHGAVWTLNRFPASQSFSTTFTFRITRSPQRFVEGSDGFAFVIQNIGPTALGGIGSSGGFAVARGDNPARPGIERSLAIFFDTHRNHSENDPSDNSIGLFTNADRHFPPRRLSILDRAPIRLNDGRPHTVHIHYSRPRLTISLDNHEVITASLELASIVGPTGDAYLGFTASTGEGYQQHDILSWTFNSPPPREQVESSIRFATSCAADKTLCTPTAASVAPLSPNSWRITLPAHLPWSASIPNPSSRPVTITNASGAICWQHPTTRQTQCHGPQHSPLGLGRIITRNESGLTLLTIDLGAATPTAEGYFTFDLTVPPRPDQ